MTYRKLPKGIKIKLIHHCEFGSNRKTKLFSVPWIISGNKAAPWYCSALPIKQGTYWKLCKRHFVAVGESLEKWKETK